MQRVEAGEAGADDDRVELDRRQLAVDRSHDEVEPGGAARQEVAHHEEAVHLTVEAPVLDADAVLRQPLGVGLALVAQRVVLGREHHGGRQAGEGVGAQRRGVRARAHRRVGRVVIPEPRHRVAAHDQLVGGIEVGVRVEVAVGDRIHEHLQRDLGPGLASPLRDDRGEAAAGAVAGDDQRHRTARDLLDVRRRPLAAPSMRPRPPRGSGARERGGSRPGRPRIRSRRRAGGRARRTGPAYRAPTRRRGSRRSRHVRARSGRRAARARRPPRAPSPARGRRARPSGRPPRAPLAGSARAAAAGRSPPSKRGTSRSRSSSIGHDLLNLGMATSSDTCSKVTSSGIPIRSSSFAQPTTFVVMRTPSSSSTTAMLYGTSSAKAGS